MNPVPIAVEKRRLMAPCLVFTCFLALQSSWTWAQAQELQGDAERWARHIETLLDVAVHTENDPKFLNWAELYCDSLVALDGFETIAEEKRGRINQTRDICGDNLNHRAPTLELFRGKPEYMGFADDAVEYALESATAVLLNKPVEFQSTTLVRDGALNAVVVQGDVPIDLWEIALDALDVETNYMFRRTMGSPKTLLDSLVARVQITPSQTHVMALAKELNVERLALFEVEELDAVEERLWMVGMRLQIWNRTEGFGDIITSTGFCEDKTGSPIALNLLDVLLWSLLLLIAIAGFEHIHWSSIKEMDRGLALVIIPAAWIRLAVDRIPKTLLFLVLPTLVAFLFIQAVGPLVPGPTTHYQEVDAKLWVIGTALGMSLLPTVLNFFVLNRFRLDGFHSMRSYRDLANVSLFGSYIPFMYIHEVNGTPLGFDFVLMLVVATWMAADLLAFNLNEMLAAKKSLRVRLASGAGLLVGVGVIVVLTFDMIGEAALKTSLQVSLLGGIANVASRPVMRWAHRKDSESKKATNEKSSLESGAFVPSVVPHFEDLLMRLQAPDFAVGFVSGPKGIGKTRLMEEVQQRLEVVEGTWTTFFGDCDEVQEEGHLAFEPFVEAFGDFLSITEVGDRTAQMDAIGQSVFSVVAEATPVPVDLQGVEHDAKQSLEDFALHLIERLEKVQGNMLLILDDVQWMDSDTHRLLEVFWGMVSRNPKLYGRMKLVVTYRESFQGAVNRVNSMEFLALTEALAAEDLFAETAFDVRHFIKGLSALRPDFTLSESSLNTLNELFNERLDSDPQDEPQVVTPLYILRTIAHFQSDKTLTPGSDGWVLTRSLNLDDLPNSEAVDAFYHNIFSAHPAKWMRVLESASIVGRSFDATVLASVWGHELLDVLDFLEQLESQGILVDVREEDNVYRFKDKRAVAAVRSYFPNTSGDRNARQIVIEYNKRLLQAEANCVPNRALYSDQQLWSHLERLSQVKGVENRQSSMRLLIEELAVRFALDAEELGTSSIAKLERKALDWGFEEVSRILRVLVAVLGEDSPMASSNMDSLPRTSHSTPHLMAYTRLLFDRNHAVHLINGKSMLLNESQRETYATAIVETGQGGAWIGVVALLMAHPEATPEFNQALAKAWQEHPPLLDSSMSLAKERFELKLREGEKDWSWESDAMEPWFSHWEDVLRSGTTRQRKIVAKIIIRHILHGAEDVQGAVQWFLNHEHHLRGSSRNIQMGWIQTLTGPILTNPYARRVLCQEHKDKLKTWFEEMERYMDLRFGPKTYSKTAFDMRRKKLLCESEWGDLREDELQADGEALVEYVQRFPNLHSSHLAEAYKVAAEVSSPLRAHDCLNAEYELYNGLHAETPQTSELRGVCARLSKLCRNRLKQHDEALRWAQESLEWAEQLRQVDSSEETGVYHFFLGAAFVELDRHKEAAEAFQNALQEWTADSDKMKYQIAVTHMHLGASQIKANLPEGKTTLKDAIEALESKELASLVSNTNARKIEDMKVLLATV